MKSWAYKLEFGSTEIELGPGESFLNQKLELVSPECATKEREKLLIAAAYCRK